MTVTAMVQVLFPATVIFENDMGSVRLPEVGEGVPQPVYVTFVFARFTLLGKSSVKLTLVIDVGPGLLIVKVRVEFEPGVINFGENDFSMLALIMLAYRMEEDQSEL